MITFSEKITHSKLKIYYFLLKETYYLAQHLKHLQMLG